MCKKNTNIQRGQTLKTLAFLLVPTGSGFIVKRCSWIKCSLLFIIMTKPDPNAFLKAKVFKV